MFSSSQIMWVWFSMWWLSSQSKTSLMILIWVIWEAQNYKKWSNLKFSYNSMQFKWVCRKNATKSRDVAFLQQKIVGCRVFPAMHTGFAGETRHLKLMVSRFSKVLRCKKDVAVKLFKGCLTIWCKEKPERLHEFKTDANNSLGLFCWQRTSEAEKSD